MNKFKNAPIHDKAKILSELEELNTEEMIKVVELLKSLKQGQTLPIHDVSGSVSYQTELEEIIERRFGKVLMSGSSNDNEINLVDSTTLKAKAKITITDR